MPPKPQQSRHRMLALVVVLGALAVLLIGTAITGRAYVTKTTQTTLDDFASGEFHKTGLLDIPERNIDSVQLIPIGLVGEWFPATHSLPIPLTELAAVAVEGHLVVIGGLDQNHARRSEVYISTLGDDGSPGPWVEQTAHPYPFAMSGAAAVAYPKDDQSAWVYVLGGSSGSGARSEIYRTTLTYTSGTIGSWTAMTPLSVPVYYHQALVFSRTIYVVGGYNPVFPYWGSLSEVFYAEIQADGSLGPWQDAENLPQGLRSLVAVGYNGTDAQTLYAIGGREEQTNDTTYKVFFADVNPDGSLTPWTQSGGSLPLGIYAHSGVMVNDQILIVGGVDANETTSDTVKAALVDPSNAGFRLYDWCHGVPPPQCEIGAWQTGQLLPHPRAFHVTVSDGPFIYTIGGVDENGQATSTIYWGYSSVPGALYSPWGHYISPEIDLGLPAPLHRLSWGATMAYPGQMTLTMQYRYKPQGGNWVAWSTPVASVSGTNVINISPPVSNVRLVQYRVDMETLLTNSSPSLDWVDIYYEVADPDLSVRKDTGSVISVPLGSLLTYTIYYSNSGKWVAENAIITETLPANTTYAGDATWHQIGTTNKYTASLGNVPPGGGVSQINFVVKVNRNVPPGVERITNVVDINYPTMYDELGQPISDPDMTDNHAEFSNPLLLYVLDLFKEAEPPSGSYIMPGQRITYTITYSNAGELPLTDLVISDAVPISTTYVSGSIFGAGADDSDPTHLRWTIPTLAPGAWGTVGFVVLVNHVADGSILRNQAVARAAEIDLESSQETVHTVVIPEIILRKTADPPGGRFVAPHQTITYTLYLTNNSDLRVWGLLVTDTVPSLTTYIPGSISGPGADDGDQTNLRWDVGTLEPRSLVTLRFRVRVNDDAPTGSILANEAQAKSVPTEVQSSNLVTHTVQPAAMVLTKNATPSPGGVVFTGQRITYTLSYFNNSDTTIGGVTLSDKVPPSTSYVPGSIFGPGGNDGDPTQLTWNIGTVPAHQGGTVGFVVIVNSDAVSGTVAENVGRGNSPFSGPFSSDPVTHTIHELHLVLTKSASPATGQLVGPGDRIAYTISYYNPAPFAVSGAVLSDTLPSIVQYVAGSIWGTGADDGNPEILRWTIGTVAAKGGGNVGFTVAVDDPVGGGMPITNRAQGRAEGLAVSSSNATVHTTDIGPAPDFVILDISTSIAPNEIRAGMPFDVPILVKNQGRVDADGIFYVEAYLRPEPATPPSGPSDHFLGYCEDTGCAVLRNNYVEYQSDLAAGDQFPFTFKGLTLTSGRRHLLCVQVDPCFAGYCGHPDWGGFAEEDEMNNIQCISVGPFSLYLPVISRNY